MYYSHTEIDKQLIPLNACLIKMSRKCGKSNCKCTRGKLHPFTGLKYRIKTITGEVKQKVKYIKAKDVEKIRRHLYEIKGLLMFDRDERYTFSIAAMYPKLSGTDICIKAYEVFRQQKIAP